ncbi:MAG: S-layer protein [Clostridiaceae bacterium]|nr:S-layer protein [Clostridiaceae bacterium]
MLLVNSVTFSIEVFAEEGSGTGEPDVKKPAEINEAIDIAYSVSEESIHEGEVFDLIITLKKKIDREDFSDIRIKFDTTASFQVSGLPNPYTLDIKFDESQEIEMLYTGGSDKNLPITIEYEFINDGDFGSTKRNLYISEAKYEPDTGGGGGGGEVDLSKYKPVLELGSSDIPTGKAGRTINIPLSIFNNSNYEARNIKITPDLKGLPFAINQMTVYETVDKLSANQTVNVEFRFNIDKYAEEKTYTLPLTIEYKNIYNIDFTENKEIYINIDNTNLPPQLVVRDAVSNPREIKPEDNFTVNFDVWNMGTLEAENVIVDLESNDYFYFMDNVTKKYLFELKGLHNEAITYSFKAKKDLDSGTYGITILLKHKDLSNPEQYTMYVTVINDAAEEDDKEENVDIITENVITPRSSVLTEQPFTVSFDIKNMGTTKAKDVKVTVESGDKILPRSLNIINIAEVEAGESINAAFSFMASKDCENRTYPIKAVIEYKNGEETVRKEQYMGVLIERPEEENEEEEEEILNTVPKIIISEYFSDPGMVNAGENFALHMTFLNTSKIRAVENMKITLIVNEGSEQTGSVFTPVQSSNTFYIDYLGPGESSSKEMVMYTIPDAKAKTYVVKALFEYEYIEQKQVKTNNSEDVFGIPVIQPAKLETSDVIVEEPAFVGEPVYITAEFYNMGKVMLSNLMVKVEGEFDTRESNYFVGNFESGYSDYYEASIIPLMPGETKGVLVFTFEDAAGKEHRIEKEFTVNAMEAAPVINPGIDFPGIDPGMGMGPGMPEPQGSKFPLIPVVIGGAVLVGIIILVIVLKRRKKRKELMLDEDI